ncbi:hypothetical protein QTO34_016973 [Cnephaeus nilssonii]|uniref:Small ribosomal subunit protein uS2 C-terminal domain-containing protein n=1 Tax=Cnephaeus nilssonii TaxID=3371016 RepID=A0AA40I485_CNENI|nr:hypothetical protein QTO34_016973 [Eptesicus nilssonii]
MLIGKFCTDLACKHPWQVMACKHPWQVMPDLCFYRNPEEIEKKERGPAKKAFAAEAWRHSLPPTTDRPAGPTAQAAEWMGMTTDAPYTVFRKLLNRQRK